jgi:arylsulfatase A-like enzyme
MGAVGAVLVLVAIYLVTQLEVDLDPRPLGSRQDIAELAQRGDVNIIFILVDTLRADRLRTYGYERPTSPGIDYLAESGVRFANHRAQSSWTKASMASLWTAIHPARTKILRYPDGVADEAETAAELLQEDGFTTAGIWRNGWVAPNFGFRQGFDLYQNPFVGQAPRNLRREARAGRIDGTDIDLVYAAAEFLRTHRDQRFMLYLHMMDVHQYVSIEELAQFGNDYSDFYDNSILWVDQQIRELVKTLQDLSLREKTMLVIASDHGEAFGEHGREGHARDLYAETTQTPFIISFPFRLDPGIVVASGSENVDIWPTLLDLVGVAGFSEADGSSLVPQLLDDATSQEHDEDFAQLDGTWGQIESDPRPIVAVREGPFRLIHRIDDSRPDELYDLESDPGEHLSVAEANPEVTARLRERAQRHFEQDPAWESSMSLDLEEMDLGQLRALGYVIK